MEQKKTSTDSNSYMKQMTKRADLNKLYKKVEKVSKRIFHPEKTCSTFVPSAQQSSSTSSTSGSSDLPHQPVLINPPYPIHPAFGSGFPPLPPQQQRPAPSYGWSLNGIEGNSIPGPATAFPLTLEIGEGDETAGSGFEHLNVGNDEEEEDISYLRPNPQIISEHKKAQSAKLERVKQRIFDEVTHLNMIANDETELKRWYEEKYVHLLVKEDEITTEELEDKVRNLEEKLKRLRARNPHGGPPPRPPPPRSVSQDGITGPWQCARCKTENRPETYRCKKCQLPSRRFDPAEIEKCGCEYCSPVGNSTD